MTEQEWLSSNDPTSMLEHAMTGRKCDNSLYCPSERKLRLFACACCRQVWHLLTDPRSRKLIEVAEKYAEGEISNQELEAAWTEACMNPDNTNYTSLVHWIAPMYTNRLQMSIVELLDDLRIVAEVNYQPIQAHLLREIVGNPFQPLPLLRGYEHSICKVCGAEPNLDEYGEIQHGRGCYISSEDGGGIKYAPKIRTPWLTPLVLELATVVYQERQPIGTLDPVTLQVLADALEEAGCTDHHILNHLRSIRPAFALDGMHLLHARGCHVLDIILGKS